MAVPVDGFLADIVAPIAAFDNEEGARRRTGRDEYAKFE